MAKMRCIDLFEHEYEFLSNFYRAPFNIFATHYKTVEHFYQSYKTLNYDEIEYVLTSSSPQEAKRRGRGVVLREDWEDIKDWVMFVGVYEKFKQNLELAHKLIKTYPHDLEEGNWWHDNYWGNCECGMCKSVYGQNKLGHILMDVRKIMWILGE